MVAYEPVMNPLLECRAYSVRCKGEGTLEICHADKNKRGMTLAYFLFIVCIILSMLLSYVD